MEKRKYLRYVIDDLSELIAEKIRDSFVAGERDIFVQYETPDGWIEIEGERWGDFFAIVTHKGENKESKRLEHYIEGALPSGLWENNCTIPERPEFAL